MYSSTPVCAKSLSGNCLWLHELPGPRSKPPPPEQLTSMTGYIGLKKPGFFILIQSILNHLNLAILAWNTVESGWGHECNCIPGLHSPLNHAALLLTAAILPNTPLKWHALKAVSECFPDNPTYNSTTINLLTDWHYSFINIMFLRNLLIPQ